MSAVLPILARYWQLAIGAVAVTILLILLSIRTGERNDARLERDEARAAVVAREAMIAAQNAGIEQMQQERAAAQERAQRAVEEARAINARQQPTIDRLRESAGRAPAAGAPCTISESLRGVDGL